MKRMKSRLSMLFSSYYGAEFRDIQYRCFPINDELIHVRLRGSIDSIRFGMDFDGALQLNCRADPVLLIQILDTSHTKSVFDLATVASYSKCSCCITYFVNQ